MAREAAGSLGNEFKIPVGYLEKRNASHAPPPQLISETIIIIITGIISYSLKFPRGKYSTVLVTFTQKFFRRQLYCGLNTSHTLHPFVTLGPLGNPIVPGGPGGPRAPGGPCRPGGP